MKRAIPIVRDNIIMLYRHRDSASRCVSSSPFEINDEGE